MHTDMKKIYIAPASTVVTLFADEDVMLALSGTKADIPHDRWINNE